MATPTSGSDPDFTADLSDEQLALMGRNFSAHLIREAFKRYKSADAPTKLSMERAFLNPIIKAAFAVKADDNDKAAEQQAADIRAMIGSVIGGGDTDGHDDEEED